MYQLWWLPEMANTISTSFTTENWKIKEAAMWIVSTVLDNKKDKKSGENGTKKSEGIDDFRMSGR